MEKMFSFIVWVSRQVIEVLQPHYVRRTRAHEIPPSRAAVGKHKRVGHNFQDVSLFSRCGSESID